MRILHGYIEEGESFADAVCRVACLAGQNRFDGYEIRCRKCDTAYPENFMCNCLREEYLELLKEANKRYRDALEFADGVVTEEFNISNYDHETVCRISNMWYQAIQAIEEALRSPAEKEKPKP